MPSTCDTIEETKQLSLSVNALLPIYIKTTYCKEPIYETVTYNPSQALTLATEQYLTKIREISDLQILSAHTVWSEDETGYTLTKTLSCIENIAKKVPIQTN